MPTKESAQKERELQLVLAMDTIRDTLADDDDPQRIFDSIVHLLKERFEADACGVILMSERNDSIETHAAIGVEDEKAVALARQAIKFAKPERLDTALWPHTLGIRIILADHEDPLGAVFIGRKSRAFDEADKSLLELAESQLDSAILQARTIWKLAQRNRELEAIFQIDRLRDDTTSESELTTGFTTILQENYKAELCMIVLTHIDSGELVVRGVIDKRDLPASALDALRDLTSTISIPQVIPTPPGIDDLTILAAPFLVSGVRLGAVVIGREKPFSVADHRLLHAMISQMDSAIIHSRVDQQLKQRNKELEAIYRIDHIRDREVDFDSMLLHVLHELCAAIASEMGYLMLYDAKKEEHLELKAATVEGLLTSSEYYDTIDRVSREALSKAQLVYSNTPEGNIRSIVATPLILNEQIIGVFGAINSANPRGFNAEDRRLVSAITSQVDTAVFERLERRRMRRVLSRSVDPKVLEHLLQRADDTVLTGERVVLSTLFADLRGSTEWAERIDPEELVYILNQFLGRMTDVIFKHGGTLDKFVGDEVIGLFGTPVAMPDHARRAAYAALEMQEVHQQLQKEIAAQGKELPAMGVGISSGEVIAGEFGPPIRTDFTAMGRVMNLGARLCGAAKGGQVIISPATYEILNHEVEVQSQESITLKGIGQPVPLYQLLRVKS